MDINFIFPGQGSQYIGIGSNIFKINDYAKSLLSYTNDILGYKVDEICINPNGIVNKTEYTQPAIFLYNAIADFIVKDNGYNPISYAGHSLGEYSALVSSGCISFEDALGIIKVRAKEMASANKYKSGKMAAIINLRIDQFEEIKSHINGIIVIANYNSNKQTIISGESHAIDTFLITAKKMNITALPLNVSGAFHSPLMNNSMIKVKEAINMVKFNDIDKPIYQNFFPNRNYNNSKIKCNLINQIISSVRWIESITNMANDYTMDFLEVGPNKVLSKLNTNINKGINSIIFEDIKSNAKLS